MKQITYYRCEECETDYKTAEECKECESRGIVDKIVSVGDIVRRYEPMGWYDGDRRWIINPEVEGLRKSRECPNKNSNCFSECCTMRFYHVVTAITKSEDDGHRWIYHLHTKAMSGKQGYMEGYVYTGLEKVNNPPKFIVRDSKDVIGKITKYLK